jgi:polysaccharide chain length determinant protein (PEP-CTERM system associated)
MLGHRAMTMEDYTGILRRRVWLIVVPALVLCGAAYVVSLKLTKKYESKTTVLVDPQRVPSELVKSLETGDPAEKLNSMKELIMSNSRLQPIVERFGLFNDQDLSTEGRVAQLQKVISVAPVEPMQGTRASTLPGFRISVVLSDPRLAQQVCAEITSMFVEEDLKGRERGAVNATNFMGEQVEAARARMNEQDQKLAQFKEQYLGALPDQEAANLNLLTGVNTQIDTVNQSIAREESSKGLWEAELAAQLAAFKASRAQGVSGTASPATLDMELKHKEDELAALQDKYADNFPNVVAKRQEIEDLKKRIAAATAAAAVAPPEPKTKPDPTANAFIVEPEGIRQLRARIDGSNLTIQDLERRLTGLNAQYKLYQSRVQSSPVVEQKYSELTRDTGQAQEDYKQLLHKRDEAEMSVALQRRQQGEQFKLVDPASYPDHPTFPNPLLFAGGGLSAGLGLGLALSLLLELRDKSLRTESDVESLLKIPILAMVPVMEKRSGAASRVVFRAGGDVPSLPVKG